MPAHQNLIRFSVQPPSMSPPVFWQKSSLRGMEVEGFCLCASQNSDHCSVHPVPATVYGLVVAERPSLPRVVGGCKRLALLLRVLSSPSMRRQGVNRRTQKGCETADTASLSHNYKREVPIQHCWVCFLNREELEGVNACSSVATEDCSFRGRDKARIVLREMR